MKAWLPKDIHVISTFPLGEQVAQINNIEKFYIVKLDAYSVKITWQTVNFEICPTQFLFFIDRPDKNWINKINSTLLDKVFQAASVAVPDGSEPDWPQLTSKLRGVLFDIELQSKNGSLPYIKKLSLHRPVAPIHKRESAQKAENALPGQYRQRRG